MSKRGGLIKPRGHKTFFSSVEHEILNAHKYKNTKKFSFVSGSDETRMLFSCSVELSMKKKSFITSGPGSEQFAIQLHINLLDTPMR